MAFHYADNVYTKAFTPREYQVSKIIFFNKIYTLKWKCYCKFNLKLLLFETTDLYNIFFLLNIVLIYVWKLYSWRVKIPIV